jgi:hypothetical protein
MREEMMKGYPKSSSGLTKQDYENLLSMPEHAEKAKADLDRLTKIDDAKAAQEIGTEEKPQQKQIDNPLPAWKRMGFASKAALASMTSAEVETGTEEAIEEEAKEAIEGIRTK